MQEPQSCLGPAIGAGSSYQFFLSGTSTPANVYQDGALTTAFPITGNVTADSFGRFPPIYLDTSIIYRVQFFDSTNTQQWQVDPYTAPMATVGTSSLSAFGIAIATTGEVTIPAPNTGGSGISLSLQAGVLGTSPLQISAPIPGAAALIVNNSATTGVRTATFTSTTKPGTTTSSPAGWLPITCDGVQYYTPIWHGNNFTPYVANPSAIGEVIVATTVTFGGNGITTVTGGTATPGSWYVPNSANIGAGYYIKITKTSGLSGINFSAANGSFANITAGGLTISQNAAAAISGTYQLSTSVTGSPVVATGTITLSGGSGVTSAVWNGATPLVLASNGTATLNGASSSSWYSPTTGAIGTGMWIKITQTGGTSGYTFSAASGAYTQIAAGLTIGISGPSGSAFSVTGTYIIASDSGGVTQLGSGTITLAGGSNVQSPNWSGTTPLILAGNGAATLNGVATSSWYSPNASNVGSGYWIKITRTGGTSGVNFSAAQGTWTNITNSGLTINITGYTGDVGTATASGTWQISSSSSGTPVLGSGNISLSISGLTVTRTYTSGTAATETVPTGATSVTIEVEGPGGSGSSSTSGNGGATGQFGGGGGAYCKKIIAVVGGNTLTYTVGPTVTAVNGGGISAAGHTGVASTVAGTVSGGAVNMSAGAGHGGNLTSGGAGGTASGGTTNTTGTAGSSVSGGAGAAPLGGVGGSTAGSNGTVPGGAGASNSVNQTSGTGAGGKIVFTYT